MGGRVSKRQLLGHGLDPLTKAFHGTVMDISNHGHSSRWDVFEGFCVLAALALRQRVHFEPEVEKEYMAGVKR